MAKAVVLACAALLIAAVPSRAEKPDPADSAKVQSCIKSESGGARAQERCIGLVADPCADNPDAQSTADQVACAAREQAGWGDNPKETHRRLRAGPHPQQKNKRREIQ